MSLSADDRDRARARAEKVVGEGHHHYCSSQGREGRKCDCYFGRGEHLVARALLESEREAKEWEENADQILGEIGGTLPS